MLLKSSPLVDELALYDIVNSPGVAADLSHINTKSVVTGYLPPDDGMAKALKGADIVVIPARLAAVDRDFLHWFVPTAPFVAQGYVFPASALVFGDVDSTLFISPVVPVQLYASDQV